MRQVGIFLFEPRDLGLHELVELGQLLPAARGARLPCGWVRVSRSAPPGVHKRTRARTLGLGSFFLGCVRSGLLTSGDDHGEVGWGQVEAREGAGAGIARTGLTLGWLLVVGFSREVWAAEVVVEKGRGGTAEAGVEEGLYSEGSRRTVHSAPATAGHGLSPANALPRTFHRALFSAPSRTPATPPLSLPIYSNRCVGRPPQPPPPPCAYRGPSDAI